MCYDDSARPPLPPIRGAALDGQGETLELTAADGNRFTAFSALAGHGAGGPGIVILPDVRGLYPFYEELALRFAEAGIRERGDDFDWMPHVGLTKPETVALDVAATAAHVRSPEGGSAQRVFTVGFCFGGRNSFNQAGRGHGLAGVIGFYGMPAARDETDTNAPVDLAPTYECPVLGLFGGADQGIPPEAVDAFRLALDAVGIANELTIYDGAPHSFFDRTFSQHADACSDAWSRILRFVGEHG
jgi:carboxymethylenebutenolidase